MLNRILALAFILSLFACGNSSHITYVEENTDFNIMAYYFPRDEFYADSLPLNQLTHIIFSFSKVIDGEMKFANNSDGERLQELVAQKEYYPDLKVMVACGGWGADGFSDAALTEESRKKFVESTIEMVEQYDLDGVDIDWEYPSIPAANTKARAEDKTNFTLLMKELREALDELDRPQILTFAAAGWERYFDNVQLTEIMKYADFINLMTYDQAGGGDDYTNHHTALGHRTPEDFQNTPLGKAMLAYNDSIASDKEEWKTQSVEHIVEFCFDAGVTPAQIVIGAAFYGKGWGGVDPSNNGLYQPNKVVVRGGNYRTLKNELINKNGFKRYWDPLAKAPFLFNATDSVFITYDDPESVKLKTSYAIDKRLGGIMFWELGGDTYDDDGLLDAIFREAHQN